MTFDEFLLITVVVMLSGSIMMAMSLQESLYRSRQAFEALVKEIGTMGLATIALDRRVESLEDRIKELGNG